METLKYIFVSDLTIKNKLVDQIIAILEIAKAEIKLVYFLNIKYLGEVLIKLFEINEVF